MSLAKAICLLLMIALNWGAIIVWFALIHIAAIITQATTGTKWSYSLFLAEDLLVNSIMGGYFRTTISAEVGNLQLKGSETAQYVASVINGLFYLATNDERQKNHCVISIENEDKFRFSPRRAIVGTGLFQLTNAFVVYRII